MRTRIAAAAAAFIILAGGVAAYAHGGATGIYKQRMDAMMDMSKVVKSLSAMMRGEVQAPIDVLRSATSINADILQQRGRLGCIKADALADLIVMRGDPLRDLSLFSTPEKNMPLVMRGGAIVRNEL